MRRKGRFGAPVSVLVTALAGGAAIWLLTAAVSGLDARQLQEGRTTLEEAIARAAVTCYANEGIYPPTLDYLEKYYGLQVDTQRYTVYYEIFADNLMPDITVLDNQNGGRS